MPATDRGKPSKPKIKAKRKPKYTLPKTHKPEATTRREKVKAGPSRPQATGKILRPAPPTSRARAQEEAYESQGKAVKKRAKEQRRETQQRARLRRALGGGLGFGIARDYEAAEARERKRGMGALRDRAAERERRRIIKRALATERAYGQSRSTVNTRTRLPYDPEVRTRRIEKLRRTRPKGFELVERELEGRGVLKRIGDKLSEGVDQAHIVSTGTGPSVPTIRRKKSGKLGPGFATTTPQSVKIPKNSIAANTLKDLVNFPAVAVPALYETGAALYEAGRGPTGTKKPDRTRLKKIAKDIDENDPVYNLLAAGVEAAGGDSKAAKKRLKRAGESAKEHPGFTALEVVGTKGVVGRSTGTVMRSGATGKRSKRAASTKRESRRVPGTDIVERREYSRDVITKAGQRAAEGTRRKIKRRYDRKAEGAEKAGKKDRADELRTTAARIDPDRLSEREIRRQVDEQLAANEDIRRTHRADTTRATRKIVKKTKREGAALSVVAQRIARADKDDLRTYVRELAAEHDSLSKTGQRANRTLRRDLERVIDDRKADLPAVVRAADVYEQAVRPLQRKLVKRGFIDKNQAERAAVIPYAVRNMKARHEPEHWVDGDGKRVPISEVRRVRATDPTAAKNLYTKVPARLVDKDGNELPTSKILAHMDKNAEGAAAFITQAPNMRGGRNFNIRSERVPAMQTQRRTGQATIKGTFDADPETLVEGAARAQGLIDAADGFKRTIKRNGLRGDDGKLARFKSWRDADEAAREHATANPGSVRFRPVRVNPQWGSKKQLDALLDEVDALDQPQANQIVTAMRDALEGKAGNGPWALIPDATAKRLLEHLDVQGGGGGIKTLQLANQAFRRNVLTTSPSKVTGDVVEGLFRASIARAGPRSYVTGKKTLEALKGMDPKAAEEAIARTVGGGHYGLARGMHMRRGAQQFEGTSLEGVANALGKFWRVEGPKAGRRRVAPGPKQFADLWHGYTSFVLDAMSNVVESQIQTAMLGRALRDSPLMDGRVLKLSEAAINDAAKGLRGTPDQIAFGRKVDRMMGKYSKYSPTMKKLLATYTPFIAWWLNAVYFVYRTLPRDHPALTALIASAEMATEEWRKDEGLDLFLEKGKLPDFMQGSIPMSGGRHQRAPNRYLPFAAFSDFSGTARGQILPLWSSPLAALDGLDWTGQRIYVTGKDGKKREPNQIEKVGLAVLSFGKGTVPWYSTTERVADQGIGTLNPFKITAPPKPKAKKIRLKQSSDFDFSQGGSNFDFSGGEGDFDFGD